MIYLKLFLTFLKVGLFAFGGGYAAVPLIRETMTAHNWFEDEQLMELIAVSESTPGPIMVNLATYIGAKHGGVLGAAVATAAVVLPAFTIILLLMKVMKNALKNEGIKAAVDGIKPAIVGIILATGIFMAAGNIFAFTPGDAAVFDLKAFVLTAVFALIYFGSRKVVKNGISPIVLILLSGAVGVVLYGI
ncbi:MAG: chromate transporter [Eubacterium sp.]|nr:chromate transporter [Eubacterium sp.]MBR7072777.1 chromate transporter [Eubacterium sp.]